MRDGVLQLHLGVVCLVEDVALAAAAAAAVSVVAAAPAGRSGRR